MENKHTPGPWTTYGLNEYDCPGVESKSSESISIVVFGNSLDENAGVLGRTVEEAKANARLIAAAPELLEALENIIDDLTEEYQLRAQSYTDGEPLTGALRSALDRARTAIAKAEGKSVPA
jgi:hypothetical protein